MEITTTKIQKKTHRINKTMVSKSTEKVSSKGLRVIPSGSRSKSVTIKNLPIAKEMKKSSTEEDVSRRIKRHQLNEILDQLLLFALGNGNPKSNYKKAKYLRYILALCQEQPKWFSDYLTEGFICYYEALSRICQEHKGVQIDMKSMPKSLQRKKLLIEIYLEAFSLNYNLNQGGDQEYDDYVKNNLTVISKLQGIFTSKSYAKQLKVIKAKLQEKVNSLIQVGEDKKEKDNCNKAFKALRDLVNPQANASNKSSNNSTLNSKDEFKPLLIIDLDETLIHSEKLSPKDQPNTCFDHKIHLNKNCTLYVNVQNNLKEFLENISKDYNLILFTASHENYASLILNYLKLDEYFLLVLDRSFCIEVYDNTFIKDLAIFEALASNVDQKTVLNKDNILIVDNNIYSFANNLKQGILSYSFFARSNENKNDLKHLSNYLVEAKSKFLNINMINNTSFENNTNKLYNHKNNNNNNINPKSKDSVGESTKPIEIDGQPIDKKEMNYENESFTYSKSKGTKYSLSNINEDSFNFLKIMATLNQ